MTRWYNRKITAESQTCGQKCTICTTEGGSIMGFTKLCFVKEARVGKQKLNLDGACWGTLHFVRLKSFWLYTKEQNWYSERKQWEKIKWIRNDTVAHFHVLIIPTPNKSTNKIHVVLNVWTLHFHTTCTFVHYKFSPLMRISYAKFQLLYRQLTRWSYPEGILERV